MTSSGTTSFALSNASITLAAYSRLQIRRPEILAQHMVDAYNEFNLMLSSFSNLQPNLWTVDLVSLPLVAGTSTYAVDSSTVMVLDAYLSFGSPQIDRLIFPISRTEYASYPNKIQQGVPSVFWFDRLISPTITFWLVPDATSTYTVNYYRCRQVQDANLANGETPNIPYRWNDALVAELAYRLARIYRPEMETARKADAKEAWNIAATQDVENVAMTIQCGLDSYFR